MKASYTRARVFGAPASSSKRSSIEAALPGNNKENAKKAKKKEATKKYAQRTRDKQNKYAHFTGDKLKTDLAELNAASALARVAQLEGEASMILVGKARTMHMKGNDVFSAQIEELLLFGQPMEWKDRETITFAFSGPDEMMDDERLELPMDPSNADGPFE